MFMHFDCVLLLHGGRICYYGKPTKILEHFSTLGFHLGDATLYNPADFICKHTIIVVKHGLVYLLQEIC